MIWVVVAVIAVVFVLIKRQSSVIEVRSDVPQAPTGAPPAAGGGSEMDEVRRLAASGQSIEAIKRFRGITGFGLAQAKDAIDLMMKIPGASAKVSFTVTTSSGTSSKTASIGPQEFARIKGLVEQGQITEAIRAVRDLTGLDHASAHGLLVGGGLSLPDPAPAPGAMPPDPAVEAQVRELIKQGQMIEAIKLFRATYGGDLKSAKEALERIQRTL